MGMFEWIEWFLATPVMLFIGAATCAHAVLSVSQWHLTHRHNQVIAELQASIAYAKETGDVTALLDISDQLEALIENRDRHERLLDRLTFR